MRYLLIGAPKAAGHGVTVGKVKVAKKYVTVTVVVTPLVIALRGGIDNGCEWL
jgi:hypothetical protein